MGKRGEVTSTNGNIGRIRRDLSWKGRISRSRPNDAYEKCAWELVLRVQSKLSRALLARRGI